MAARIFNGMEHAAQLTPCPVDQAILRTTIPLGIYKKYYFIFTCMEQGCTEEKWLWTCICAPSDAIYLGGSASILELKANSLVVAF